MDNICPICFDQFDAKQVASTDVCDHLFCFSCLEKWAKLGSYCPVDRKRFKKIIKLDTEDVIQVKPRKRKKSRTQYDVTAYCEVCRKTTSSATLLLCDCCDLAYHCKCLTPPLTEIPAGLWFCPPCVQVEERLRKRNGTSKECEIDSKPQVVKETPMYDSFAAENERFLIPKLKKKKHFEEFTNPSLSAAEDEILIKQENSTPMINKNAIPLVVLEKLDFTNILAPNNHMLKSSSFQNSEKTETFAETESSTVNEDCALSFSPKQDLSIGFLPENNVQAKDISDEIHHHGRLSPQGSETKTVRVVPEAKNFQFSIFKKLEDISLTKLKLSELATVTNDPKRNTPCDICKCWKMKSKKNRLDKLLKKKKDSLSKHSPVRYSALVTSPPKMVTKESTHKRHALIREIQQIQQEKWKLNESYKLKKRRIMKKLKKQIEMTDLKVNSQSCDLLAAGSSSNKNITHCDEEVLNFPSASVPNGIESLSKLNSKVLKSSVRVKSTPRTALSSGSCLKKTRKSDLSSNNFREVLSEKSVNDASASGKVSHQNKNSKNFNNLCIDTVKTEKTDNTFPKSFHLSDLKHLVIRSDGSLFLDYPQ